MLFLKYASKVVSVHTFDNTNSVLEIRVYQNNCYISSKTFENKEDVVEFLNLLMQECSDYEVEVIESRKVPIQYENTNRLSLITT